MIVLPKVKQSNKKIILCPNKRKSKYNFKGFSTNVVNDTERHTSQSRLWIPFPTSANASTANSFVH